ncbi:hypothetical protein EMPG_12155 [Blastomyces silverae]|uniref:NACHT domain-containing protein n=1 Tax=Blastomyces silverae TaxID=2060906 RepID=A0A0H1BPB4_9EURO|nr:hypothetical protein EMPG_12155 [Blastomyces silverae]
MPLRTKLMSKLGFGHSSRRKSQIPNYAGSREPSTSASSSPSSPSSPSPSNQTSAFTSETVVSKSNTEQVRTLLDPPLVPATAPTDLWFDALQRLSSDDQQIIQAIHSTNATTCPLSDRIKELVRMTRMKQQECETKYYTFSFLEKKVILRDVAEKTIFWLNKFKGVGDVAVGFDQAHASLPWAGVRLILQAAVAESEQMGALLVAVETVTYLVGRCTVYESLYQPRNTPAEPLKNFHAALVELYAAVLQLLALSHRLFSKNTATRTLHALVSPNKVLESVTKCQDLERRVDIEASNCERALSRDSQLLDTKTKRLLEYLSTPILRCDENVSSLLETVTDKERLEILDWISGVLYGQNHSTVKDSRTPGTCEWLLEHSSYTEWKKSSSSVILWLDGTAGTGKTYVTSRVIDEIRSTLKTSSNDEGFAFFYCNRNESIRREPLAVLRSFVRQLSSTVNYQHSIQKRVREYYLRSRQGASEPTIRECKELLLELINIYPKTTLILDALDECEERSRTVLFELFDYLVTKAAKPVKVFISSRPDIDIKNTFRSHANIRIQASDNDDDISKFVKSEITRHPRWNKMSVELRNDIIKTLQQGSQGMFQWAYLQIKQLLVLQQENPIRDRLGKLPIDLEHAYDEIFDAMDESERKVAHRALQWVMCSNRPLSTRLLLPAVCQAGDDLIHPIDDLDEDLVLKYCHNLVVIDPITRVWLPSHLSVIEYCESRLWSQQQANCFVASVCLSLLNNAVYAPPSKRYRPKMFPQHGPELSYLIDYSGYHVISHVKMCEDGEVESHRISNLLERFLGSPAESSMAYQNWVEVYNKDRIQSIPFCDLGVQKYNSLLPGTISAFAVCLFGLYKTVPNWWANPWPCLQQRNATGLSLLHLAAKSKSISICKHLLSWGTHRNKQPNFDTLLALSKCDANGSVQMNNDNHSIIMEVATHKIFKYHDIFESVLMAAVSADNLRGNFIEGDVMTYELWGSTLVMTAHSEDNRKLTQLLLNAGVDVNEVFTVKEVVSAHSVLTSQSFLNLTKLLQEHGAKINVSLFENPVYTFRRPAISLKDVVGFLTDSGVEIEIIHLSKIVERNSVSDQMNNSYIYGRVGGYYYKV